MSTEEANCVKLPKTIYGFEGVGYPSYRPLNALVTFCTFLFTVRPPPSTYHARFDNSRFTRYHFHTFSLSCDLCHPSTHCPFVHLIRPPCPPICLCTLLLFDLDCSSTLHPPDPTILMLFYSPTSSFRHFGLRPFSRLDTSLA